jgi:hypothetical protein
MIEIITLPLVCFGIVLILIEGSIFQGYRDWLVTLDANAKNKFFKWITLKLNQLFNCYMCLGFQCGWIIGFFSGPFDYWNVLYNGAFYAATTWIIHAIVQFLGNGNDPNRSIIVQFPESIKVEKVDHLLKKDINS